jgi:hypothetical protein
VVNFASEEADALVVEEQGKGVAAQLSSGNLPTAD